MTIITQRHCSVKDCKDEYYAKYLCKKHYSTQYKVTHKETPEYMCWASMKQRCCNKNCPYYINYGGRGIKVCDEWLNDYKAFYKYIGDRPSPNHSIDRINNDGNYEPGNVRWATRSVQLSNQRPRRPMSSTGFKYVYRDSTGRGYNVAISHKHIGHFKTIEEAVNCMKEYKTFKPKEENI